MRCSKGQGGRSEKDGTYTCKQNIEAVEVL
jgi:hypothetical protein